MNHPDLNKALVERGIQIGIEHPQDISGTIGMEVKGVLDGHLIDRFRVGLRKLIERRHPAEHSVAKINPFLFDRMSRSRRPKQVV
jgi:hypothetical protein